MTDRYSYYSNLKSKAIELRKKHEIEYLRRLTPTLIKNISKKEGINHFISFPYASFKSIRGAYEYDEIKGGIVYYRSKLPMDPLCFTLAHELKHHLFDRHLGNYLCTDKNQKEEIEIGAEIFAAELLYPEDLFLDDFKNIRKEYKKFAPEILVKLKHRHRTTLSYSGLAKRTSYLNLCENISLSEIKWKYLENKIYPNPFIKK